MEHLHYSKRGVRLELPCGVLEVLAFAQALWIRLLVTVVGMMVFGHYVDEPLHGRAVACGGEEFPTVIVERIDGTPLVGLR